jgi:hypothetical protein
MNKQLNLVINGKGGVGKSFFATNLITYLVDQSIAHVAVDTDHENSTLMRFHPDATFVDIDHPREVDGIFDLLQRADLVAVDCRAASTDLFLDYFAEISLSDILKHAGAVLTLIVPVNHEADSVEQVHVLSDALQGRCQYVIVKNQAHSEQFRLYERSASRQRVLNDFGGREIIMPRMQDWLVAAMNEHDLTTTKALSHPAISVFDRQRIKNWQRQFNEQVALAGDVLLSRRSGKTASEATLK